MSIILTASRPGHYSVIWDDNFGALPGVQVSYSFGNDSCRYFFLQPSGIGFRSLSLLCKRYSKYQLARPDIL